jgi:hypothetical protein
MNSALTRPLNDSQNALSVGFPGREIDLEIVSEGPLIDRFGDELCAIMCRV